jgi:transcriptional regulator with XRE-family HTH domain
MPQHRLDNYLRRYRKRAGLSQKEVCFLLGSRDGTMASRYERFARTPTLETALAYGALLQVPVNELFGGLYERAKRETARRAKLLARKLATSKGCRSARAFEKVAALAGKRAPHSMMK